MTTRGVLGVKTTSNHIGEVANTLGKDFRLEDAFCDYRNQIFEVNLHYMYQVS